MGVYMGLQAAITLNRAYDEGGMKGLATSAGSLGISAYVQTVSAGLADVNFSYTRDGGFGGMVSFGNQSTWHGGVGYSQNKDWNANVGYQQVTVGVSKTGQDGWGGSVKLGAYEASYSEKQGFGAAISVNMGQYGSMRFGMQFDDHMGWKGADVSYTTKETAGKQFGGTQTFGFGYNEDSGYRLTASTNVKTAGGLRANTTNSFSFDKDGTFSGAAIDASMRFTYVNYQDMRERSKRTDEEMSAAEREAAERAREEMGWFDRTADMLSGAWLSMNGTLWQWEKDITKMISDFGESLGNWFTGNGFYTNKEMAVNAAMKELGRQEAVAAALGAYEEFSKNYDVAVKGAMGEYDRIQEAYKAASGEYEKIQAAYGAAEKEYEKLSEIIKRVVNLTLNQDKLVYFNQNDNKTKDWYGKDDKGNNLYVQGWNMCQLTATAMAMAAEGIEQKTDKGYADELYDIAKSKGLGGAKIWENTSVAIKTVLTEYGKEFEAYYLGNQEQKIKELIDSGKTVITGTKATDGGHIILITGYDKNGWIVNDPYGNRNLNYDPAKGGLGGTSGQQVHYNYGKWKIGKRWIGWIK